MSHHVLLKVEESDPLETLSASAAQSKAAAVQVDKHDLNQ